MEQITIDVEQGKYLSAKEARKAGQLPMIYYGKGVEPIQMTTDYQNFRRAYRKGGRSSIFMLKLAGKELQALVHEIQYHPVSDDMHHVDLMAVKAGQKVHAEVPLMFVGEAPAVKELGGTFMATKDMVAVECLPKDLPHDIQVEVSVLVDFHSHITVGDIQAPNGVKIMDAPEINVASVAAPRVEQEEAPALAVEIAEVKPEEGTEEKK